MPDAQLRVAGPDVQAQVPGLQIGLSRVGVTGVEKVIRIRQNGSEQLFYAKLDCFVDLGSRQKGAHMSRFEEVVNQAIGDVIIGEATFRAESLAQHVAELVRDRQGARRAEVTIAARYPEHKPAPVSGIMSQEIYTLFGSAVASERGTRRLVGVAAAGITACPCAQQLISADARDRLRADGFDDDEIDRIFAAVPVATHNQRGLGTLHVGATEGQALEIDAQRLLAIVEQSMSAEIFELMKRTDEAAVVEKAHRRPRFVEDCVREMLRGVVDDLTELADDAFVSARQENLETIHQHNVLAERHGTVGEIRAEIATGEPLARHTTLSDWLDDAAPTGRGSRR
jgi:GTP cyclohydrolase-4